MHTLKELKDLFITHNIKIKQSGGWFLKVGKDTYTMLDDDYFKNNVKISRKEILAILKNKKKK
jgi:hypothetical protein